MIVDVQVLSVEQDLILEALLLLGSAQRRYALEELARDGGGEACAKLRRIRALLERGWPDQVALFDQANMVYGVDLGV